MSIQPFPPPPKGASLDMPALARWLLAVETWGKQQDRRTLALEGDSGAAATVDGTALHSFMHAGGSGWSSWRQAGALHAQNAVGVALTANQLRAVLFVAPRSPGHITDIGFEVSIGLAGNARCGVYSNKGDSNLCPDKLLVDGGSFSTAAAAVKSTTGLNVPLTPGQPYWLVHVQDVAATTRCLTAPADVLGHSNDATGQIWVDLRVAFTFAALPATFPAGALPDTNTGTATTAVPGLYFKVSG